MSPTSSLRSSASHRESLSGREELSLPNAEDSLPLSICVVYEDAPTRSWAAEVCERVTRLVGKDALHATWWKLTDLGEPAVLAGAVSTTLRADIIIVAIRAAEGLPLPFYVWVDSWLPHHPQGNAALVALITLPDPPTVQLDRARAYLRAVARQGRLDFLLEERRLPAVSTTPRSAENETSDTAAGCPGVEDFQAAARPHACGPNAHMPLKAAAL